MRNIGLDLIKGLAIIAVILIHTSYFYFVPPLFFIGFEMPFFIVVIGVTHMLSLKNRQYTIIKHFDQITRILIPALPFLLVFLIFRGTYSGTVGSFFIPLLIQIAILFPLFFFAYRWNRQGTIVLFFLLDLVFELIAPILPYEIYRACILRYLFAIALGMYLGDTFSDKISDSSQKPIFILGIFSAFVLAFGLSSSLPFRHEWLVQNPLTFGYAAMVTMVAIRLPDIRNRGVAFLAWIGENSYYIYLVQMIFFVGVLPLLPADTISPTGIIACALAISITGGIIYGYVLDRMVLSKHADYFSKLLCR